MSYLLVSAKDYVSSLRTANILKARLGDHLDNEVIIVQDFNFYDDAVTQLAMRVLQSNKPDQEKLAMLLKQRKKILQQQILPALNEGKRVLYIGGIVQDMDYMKGGITFDVVLRENLELLQSLGGVAYPAGVVYHRLRQEPDGYWKGFLRHADKFVRSTSRAQLLRYDDSHPTLLKIAQALK